jgi:Flp pilus assembly protein CpaB
LKRSNRLVLLVGVFLAIVAFVGILLLTQGGPDTVDPDAPVTELPTVIATTDIPLGSAIREDQGEVQVKPVAGRDTDAFGDESQVIGQIARQPVIAGAAITGRTLALDGSGTVVDIRVPEGRRALSIRVDQETGVGTVIKPGDYVDLVVSVTDPNMPLVVPGGSAVDEVPTEGIPLPYGPLGTEIYNPTTTKVLLQGIQILGTLLPPVAPQAEQPPAGEGTGGETDPGTALTGQEAIVILSLDAQQAEIVRWAQIDGTIALALRSPEDFVDEQGNQVPAVVDPTTGIVLRTLVDTYGVLPPEVVQAVPVAP